MSSFALPAWAARASNWLNAWGPIAWVACGFLGVAVALAIMWAAALRNRYALMTRILRHTTADGDGVNPLESTFIRKRIKLSDLAEPVSGSIRHKTFVDCEIVGPGNAIAFPSCIFAGSGGEMVDAVVFTRGRAIAGYELENCTFRNCKFFRLTFLIPHVFYETFHRHGWEGLVWLTETPAQPQLPIPEGVNPVEEVP